MLMKPLRDPRLIRYERSTVGYEVPPFLPSFLPFRVFSSSSGADFVLNFLADPNNECRYKS